MPRYSDAIEAARRERKWFEAMQRKLRKEADALEPIIARFLAQEQELMRLEDEAATSDTLTSALTAVKVNVNKPVTDEHRFNISKGQKRGDKFLQAITAAEFTQKTLAEKLDIAPALLSMYRKNKRPIPRERAEEIEKLTGWKATLRNWPGGIVS